MKDRNAEAAAKVVVALMHKHCGMSEICAAIGVLPRQSERAKPFIEAFRRQGLVYIAGYSHRGWPIYGWQSTPFAQPDAINENPRKAPTPRQAKPMQFRANSVFALGAQ